MPKNISSISYNHLNLPKLITFSTGNSIEFLYDAAGTQLRKTTKTGTTIQYVQDYLPGGLEYRQSGTGVKRLESVFHPEGRYYNTNVELNNTYAWRKEYNFRDHLGNTRLVFTDRNGNGVVDITGSASTSDILQENHYYSFGLGFEGPWLMNDGAERDNAYQYNGKELHGDFGLGLYAYGARYYDPSIGRFTGVDPLASDFPSWSPNSYTFNNPIRFIDPDGRAPDDIILRGKNNSSITIKTDLVNIDLNAGSIVGDLGGNYTLAGNDVVEAALDIGGLVDPTGAVDAAATVYYGQKGEVGNTLISAASVIPGGDLLKGFRAGKHVKTITKAIDGFKEGDKVATTSRAARREAMRDAGIPTSQPLIPDKVTKSGDKVYLTRDGKSTVQNATNDVSHQGQPHWEAGPTKRDPSRPRWS